MICVERNETTRHDTCQLVLSESLTWSDSFFFEPPLRTLVVPTIVYCCVIGKGGEIESSRNGRGVVYCGTKCCAAETFFCHAVNSAKNRIESKSTCLLACSIRQASWQASKQGCTPASILKQDHSKCRSWPDRGDVLAIVIPSATGSIVVYAWSQFVLF